MATVLKRHYPELGPALDGAGQRLSSRGKRARSPDVDWHHASRPSSYLACSSARRRRPRGRRQRACWSRRNSATSPPSAISSHKRAPVDAVDRRGLTPLMWAAAGGNTEVVRQLLDSGACVDRRANDGSTALMIASANGFIEIVRALVLKGADVTATRGGVKARQLAVERGHADVAMAARPGRGTRPPAAAGRERRARHGRPPGARAGCAGQHAGRARRDRADDRGAQRRPRHAAGALVERRRCVDSRQPGTYGVRVGRAVVDHREVCRGVPPRARRLEGDAPRRRAAAVVAAGESQPDERSPRAGPPAAGVSRRCRRHSGGRMPRCRGSRRCPRSGLPSRPTTIATTSRDTSPRSRRR